MKTSFGNLQREVDIDRGRVRKLVSALAGGEGVRAGEVTLVFVDDAYIAELNRRYLGENRATDVLAFPLGEASYGAEAHPSERGASGSREVEFTEAPSDRLVGEVYISTERAIEQARENHVALSEEIARLIVHGLLHLFGYRDDRPSRRREMVRRQESFLRENKGAVTNVAKRSGCR